ncbi:MAG: energy transducer TonB [Woeseiaceae bacterium]
MTRFDEDHPGRTLFAVVACLGLSLLATASFSQSRSSMVRHFTDTNTDRVPALTAFPKYPSIARRDRIEGEATVCFKIRANGKISRAVVTDKTHRIFAKPALRAIRKSSFEPIGPGQTLATARTCRIYRFRLDPIVADNPPPK